VIPTRLGARPAIECWYFMPAEPSSTFATRAASLEDRPRLYDIHRAAMGPYVTELWGWDDAWQAEAFARGFDPTATRVIVVGEQLVGFFETHEDAEAVTLSKIALDPAFQGRGIATGVIADLLAEARARGKPVRLQVFKINPRARSLYRRLGFLETGETATHVQMAAPARA
jgi:ribosomal protein S18 acetylase RimI-like enzyme